jgi:hypothetical protein
MTVHELSLETLGHLDDGRVQEAWRQAVRRAVADCEDRPGVLEARKVMLQFEIYPLMGEDGSVATIKGGFQVKDSIPTRKSKVYEFQPRGGLKLAFNDLSDDNVQQRTLDEIGGFDAERSD